VAIASENRLRERGGVTLLGTSVDLASVTTDSYLVAGVADHIAPWQNSYRTTQLLGGGKRFVLSNSGHIAAIINPPTNKKASFRTAGEHTPADPAVWMRESVAQEGSWWTDWNVWLAERSGGTKPAPRRLQIAQQRQHLITTGAGLLGKCRRGQPIALGEHALRSISEQDLGSSPRATARGLLRSRPAAGRWPRSRLGGGRRRRAVMSAVRASWRPERTRAWQ
jgi:hypothetical protein